MRLSVLLLPILCIAPTAAAQEMGPAKELARFDKLLGHWQGSGSVRSTADAEPYKWTATAIAKKVLNGQFIQEDVEIDFGESMAAKLVFRNFYGFDRETKHWMAYGINNMGGITKNRVFWADGKMLTGNVVKRTNEQGQKILVVDRWSYSFDKDSYSLRGYEAHDNGRPFQHVTGTYKRVKAVEASATSKQHKAFVPVAKEMGALSKWAGSYQMKGWMLMAPGAPKTEISAKETITSIFGGTTIAFDLTGEPIPQFGSYKGWGAFLWNAERGVYETLWIDNMGVASVADAYMVDGEFVIPVARKVMGKPSTSNTVFSIADDGKLASVREFSTMGTSNPFQSFKAKYASK